MTTKLNPSTEEYEWLIGARARIQKSLMVLYKLHEIAKDEEKKPNKHKLGLGIGRLVGAAFSLWRAAPLLWHNEPRNNEEEIKARGDVLNYLLRDNAINFPQDRISQHWMGGYYIHNAKDRLKSLSEENTVLLEGYNVEGRILCEYWDDVCSVLDDEIEKVNSKLTKNNKKQ